MILDRLLELRGGTSGYRNPSQWFIDWITNGSATKAGESVNETKALTLPALFRAVDNICSHIAMLPLPVIQKGADGKRTHRPGHPVHQLLNVAANDDLIAMSFRRALMLHTLLWGTGRAEILRNRNQRPYALRLLPPESCTTKYADDGELVHEYRDASNKTRLIYDSDTIRVPHLSYDGIEGMGLISQIAKENLGLSLALQTYASRYFGNSTILGTVFSTAAKMNEEERKLLKRNLEAAHGGPDKAFKPFLSTGGEIKADRLGAQNDHAQTLELMTFSVQDVARWLNVPPPMLMELSRATFSNITEQGRWYVAYTLLPWFKLSEQEMTRKLFTAQERGFYVEHNAKALMRATPKDQAEYYKSMVGNGFMTINEVRQLENMDGIGEAGDEHFMQMNMTTVERLVAGEEAPDTSAGDDSTRSLVDAWCADVSERVKRKHDKAVARARKRHGGDDLAVWLEGLYRDLETEAIRQFGDVAGAAGRLGMQTESGEAIAARLISKLRGPVMAELKGSNHE